MAELPTPTQGRDLESFQAPPSQWPEVVSAGAAVVSAVAALVAFGTGAILPLLWTAPLVVAWGVARHSRRLHSRRMAEITSIRAALEVESELDRRTHLLDKQEAALKEREAAIEPELREMRRAHQDAMADRARLEQMSSQGRFLHVGPAGEGNEVKDGELRIRLILTNFGHLPVTRDEFIWQRIYFGGEELFDVKSEFEPKAPRGTPLNPGGHVYVNLRHSVSPKRPVETVIFGGLQLDRAGLHDLVLEIPDMDLHRSILSALEELRGELEAARQERDELLREKVEREHKNVQLGQQLAEALRLLKEAHQQGERQEAIVDKLTQRTESLEAELEPYRRQKMKSEADRRLSREILARLQDDGGKK